MEQKITPVYIHIHPFIEYNRTIEYLRNGKTIKRKVKLKEPEAHFNVSMKLEIEADLMLNGIYIDNEGTKWVCTSISNFSETKSKLTSASMYISKDSFYIPNKLQLVSISITN